MVSSVTAYSWRERRPKLERPTERSVRESHEDHYSSVSVVPSSLCEGFATKSNAMAFRGSGLVVRITDRAVTHVKSRSQMLSGARFRRAKTNVLFLPSPPRSAENYVLRVTNIKAGNIVHVGLDLKPRDSLLRGAENTTVGILHVSSSADVDRFVSQRMNFRDKSTLKFVTNLRGKKRKIG